MPENAGRKKIPPWVTIICLATLVFGVAGHDLWTPDEPREAEIARAMAAGKTWLFPRLAGLPFVEKPPLYYWVSAAMMLSLGKITSLTTAARATSALFAALTAFALWLAAGRYLGKQRALGALLILLTTAGFFHVGHWIIMDSLLMFLPAAAVLLLFYGLDRSKPLPLLGGYLAAALGFLTKGFVAWVLIAVPWALLFFLYFSSVRRRLLLHLAGVVLLLAPVGAWMAAFRHGGGEELFREWFINNQIGRFLGHTVELGHLHGPFYYLLRAPVFLLPWTPVLLGWIVHRGWRRGLKEPSGARNLVLLAAAWAFGGLFLLSLAGTKRSIYFYPLIPAFALLSALYIRQSPKWVRVTLMVICVIILLPMIVLSVTATTWSGDTYKFQLKFNFLVLVCAALGIFSFIRFKENPLVRVAAVSGLAFLTIVFSIIPFMDSYKSYGPQIRHLVAAIPPGAQSYTCGWSIDETTRAFFSYHSGLTVINIEDPERLVDILNGRDERFYLVVSRRDRFPFKNPDLPPLRILTEEKMGKHRHMILIAGETE